ncbi:MAG: hypothetical protein JEZ06_05205 [Anaerolineaceae bacterium]|nr:hypothetical protein [Anaerolineaceae bacterium]
MKDKKRFFKNLIQIMLILTMLLATPGCTIFDRFFPSQPGNSDPVEQPIEGLTPESDNIEDEKVPSNEETEETTFNLQLSDGQPEPTVVEELPLSSGEPLSSEEIAMILNRLPEMESQPEDQQDFKLPGDPIPPPQPGENIDLPFPPPPESALSPEVDSGPLEVLRFAPEGEIPMAPFINVTFNQPMVALGTLSQLSEEDVPVLIKPALEGKWTWIGTRTLRFQYDSALIDRLPMATEFQVTIPAGTLSAAGNTLAESVSWAFSTPPVKLIQSWPNYDPQPLDPLFFMAFDQRIDPETTLQYLTTSADGQEFEIQLASPEEIEKDSRISSLVKNTAKDRWVVFKAKNSLPADSEIYVSIDVGTPSLEGPLVTQETQGFGFYTYAPLSIEDHGCSWGYEECPPLSPFYIQFNNAIDPDLFDDSLIDISPDIPGMSTIIYGDNISISGATEGRTTYRVTLDKELTDIFGQKLGRDVKLTFKVGKAEAILVGPDRDFVTLDPAAEPILSLYTINYDKLDVEIYAVEPSDWPQYKAYLQDFYRTDQPIDPPGRRVFKDSIRTKAPNDALTEVGIDLSQVMDDQFGHFIVIVKPPKGFFEKDNYWETIQTWVQVTQIGLDAFVDHTNMVTWATNLQNGAPLEGITVQADSGKTRAATGADGVAEFALPANGILYLTATNEKDTAMLPSVSDYMWQPRSETDNLQWYVMDDRNMYRPGEEVHVKGWMRLIGGGQQGDVELLGDKAESINYTIIGPQGNELGVGTADVNHLGGFDFAFTLPEHVNLGYAEIMISAVSSWGYLNQDYYYHTFQIQEFRRPEFEVIARNETTGPYFTGEDAIVAVEAAYYAGGPLPNAETNWYVSSSPTNYHPPNWTDFSFGTWTPWWYYGPSYGEADYGYGGWQGETSYASFTGTTDASGNHYLKMDFDSTGKPQPYSIFAEATVMDVNRQAWAGSTSLMVHPADLYVGLRSERYFVERGDPLDIDLIVTDLDGNPVADRQIKVSAARLVWKYEKGTWQETHEDKQSCTVGSTMEPVSCSFETPLGGRYQITALTTDSMGRKNQSSFTRWVSGSEQAPSRKVEMETATLIPDKETYQPGDIAEILVQSPFTPAEGLLTVARSGFLYTERFVIEDGSKTLKIPINESHIPNLHVQVDLVGSADRTDDQGDVLDNVPPRPAYASNQLFLEIPALERTLSIEAAARESHLEPGGETMIDVALKDAEGQPVADAEFVVVVVDESILALTNYQLTDPISIFYYTRPSGIRSTYSRSSIILVDPQVLAEETRQVANDKILEKGMVLEEIAEEVEMEMAPAPSMEPAMEMADGDFEGIGGGEGNAATPITVRMDFNPLALFAPESRTNSEGKASVEISLPDNLTRYRIMVVAVDPSGKQFGSAETNMTARLPLMVRPSASRFLNFGDQFELPVVLQNQTDEDMQVEVVAEFSNLDMTGDQGLRVEVPANDRIEVRFPGTTETAGTARVRLTAVSGNMADSASVSLPVYTPATTEAFATYGVVDEGAVMQPVASPEGVFPQYGGLEITTSSTALQALTDAVLYLVSYPFDCTEQISSRMLAIAALRDVLTAFEAEGLPSPETMEASVTEDIEELAGLQNYDGGFPYWRRGYDSIPYNTVHVAHALQRARMMGYEVPENMWQDVLSYLQYIEDYYPYWYSQRTRETISSYALYVRQRMGDPDPEKAYALLQDSGIENLSLDALAWLWQVLVDTNGYEEELTAIRKHVNNQAIETAAAANFITAYDDDAYVLFHSNRRTDALLLDAIIADDPNSDLIPKVVNGLLAHRKKGRWYNTQENIFVLLAMDRYFDTFESQEPDFVARIWLGDNYAGSSEFSGYTTERHQIDIPMNYLTDSMADGEEQNLIIEKNGAGRLYYRLGLRYAPTDLKLDPVDMGFVVQREYEGADDLEDVTRDEEGIWHIKAGARVRIRVTMVADNRRYHVALVDPLPAGLEIINPALATSESVPRDPGSSDSRNYWWWWTWYEHQNMRDERAEAFTSLLWEGLYEYTYVTRATMPGTFVVPPAKAEEMYSPEVFGRSGSDLVIIE